MILGLLFPTKGNLRVLGRSPREVKTKARIGYLPESAPSYSDMSVIAFLNFAADMRGLQGEVRKQAIRRVVQTCHLDRVLAAGGAPCT